MAKPGYGMSSSIGERGRRDEAKDQLPGLFRRKLFLPYARMY
jgi:hypothetical protein